LGGVWERSSWASPADGLVQDGRDSVPSSLVCDVALTIHYYEAVLACLAIVVWHFYHVMFDPMFFRSTRPVGMAAFRRNGKKRNIQWRTTARARAKRFKSRPTNLRKSTAITVIG